MRVLVWNGPWDLEVGSRPDPEPGPGEVLVRVAATGICGSDIHGYSGETGRRRPGQVMGHETVGHVVSVGEGVENRPGTRPGDVVTVNPLIACRDCAACAAGSEQSCANRRVIGVDPTIVSAFSEAMAVPATNVVGLPESMPLEYGALIEPLSVGFHAARRGGCGPQDSVLVVGGGPIGQACVLAARRLGAERVVVTEPDEHRRTLAASLGAVGVDPTAEDAERAVTEALGGTATLVLDAVGTTRTLADAVRYSSFGSRVVLVGMGSPSIELAAYAISTEERTLVGSFCFSAEDFRTTAEWVGTAPAELAHLVDDRVDLDAAPEAFSQLASGTLAASKVLVFPHGVPTT
jgi:threonine dehydrogenase-like Zn-dependent dehydrogenase